MRSKRLFAILLAFCLVFSNLAPAAFAVKAPESSVLNAEQNAEEAATANNASPNENDLVLSGDSIQTPQTIRDALIGKVEANGENADNNWTAAPTDKKPEVSFKVPEVPQSVQELRDLAETYSADEIVSAFVVMEAAPLAETYSSRSLVSAGLEAQMIEKQNVVINAIERTVLGGEKLEVRYQFTYLTNSFTIRTAFGNLEKIAGMAGVKSVFLTPVFEPCTTSSPNTASSGAMTGVDRVWEDYGYTGTGMKIAIIDTGLDLDHPSFAADPELNANSMTQADIAAVLENLNAYALRSTITEDTLYRSAKVPYAFNYVDASLTADHSADQQGDHGTHVAGIAAANAVEGTSVVGMAPDAQIIVMKVFGANGGAYMDDIVAALEDAMTLGCDVVNASLGSPAGFSTSGYEEQDAIYERIASQDIVVTFSAGNEGTSSYGNMWGTDLNRTQNPDNATVGSPSTYANVMSIASAENAEVMTPYFNLGDGTQVFYMDPYQYYYNMLDLVDAGYGELEYVIIDGLGEYENFFDAEGNSLVEGKVAVIRRGDLSFGTKILNAEYAGAVAAIIWDNVSEDIFTFGMQISDDGETYPMIPSCLISLEDGEIMAALENKTLTVSAELAGRAAEGGQMSSFSSWGASPDLRLLPDITGIGGNVYSCYDGGQYGLMSGTSMSAPQLAGISALVMQHLQTLYPNAPEGTIRELTEAVLMSTADPIISSVSGSEASPRQQGAGLVDAHEATTTTTYLTVNGGRPKAELGDSSTGVFKFSFEVHNFGTEEKTYVMASSLLTEYVAAGYGQYFMYGVDIPLEGTVSFDQETVTVPANGSVTVNATITLSEEDKAYFAAAWENGGYVEGYVYLCDEEGTVQLNMPFMGFYGDWTEPPVFDGGFWYDNGFWGVPYANGLPESDEYYNVIWTDLGGTDWVLGFNPYSGAVADQYGNIVYDPAYNVVSPNGDGVLDGITEIYLSLLRNAKTLTFTYTVDGEVVHRETITDSRKTMYQSSYGQVVPWIYSWYSMNMYDFTDANGKTLPSGTEVLLTIDGTVDYGTGGDHTIEIPITVDTNAPKLIGVEEVEMDGNYYLGVQVSDDIAMASVVLMNPTGTKIYAQGYDVNMYQLEDGTYIAYFDVTGLGTEFMVAVCDYAANESYYDVSYNSAEGGNVPEMDTSILYAYRVYDNYIMSDHMYGWISMNKPVAGEDAEISILTDDYLEYAAINAAEYVDGKVFAVDAVYNFVVMDPGLWNSTQICNLGHNVHDLTFDDSTGTMYALVKDGSYTSLYTLDIMTGEMTKVADYGYYTRAPWSIADDDNGTIYAIQYGSGVMYTLDAEDKYALTPVTDADGNEIVITDSYGEPLSPEYSQGMVYDNGVIYYAYYKYSWMGDSSELIAINTADWTCQYSAYSAWGYDADNNLVNYYPTTELVGLMVFNETDYTIPEAAEATAISLSASSMIMGVGQSGNLKASATPWNYELPSVNWSSSDESVVTVADGTVTAVGEGTAIVTASYNGLTAECEVVVVDVSGNFYAYNYYSGDGYYGYMIDVDMETMDYGLVDAAPADFLAGDYNGHDGYFYGYTEGGQFWRYDINNSEAVKLGDPIGVTPLDMAYDYSTGLMYALTTDYNTGVSTVSAVNLKNGQLQPVFALEMYFLQTLACDDNGDLYSISADGVLFKIDMGEYGPENIIPMMYGLGEIYYAQSMCYDYNNDVLLWAYCEGTTVVWIDVNAEVPYAISLGDPTESGLFEFVGMFTIPETIPAAPSVAVEGLYAEDMMMLTGAVKYPNCTIMPLNASSDKIYWSSSDATVVSVNADGALVAEKEGTATITGTLKDRVSRETFEVSFEVTVLPSADNIYGFVMTDMATMGGSYWARLYATNPNDPDILTATNYILYSEEYYDGKIYAIGFDGNDYSGNMNLLVIDANTMRIESQVDLGAGYPFVYDLTYDYNTSTMYAVAGPETEDTNLYAMNMETGELLLILETEQLFMSLAAGPDGLLYAMEQSKETIEGDEWDPWGGTVVVSNTNLWTIDPVSGEVTLIGDTGMKNNMIASMSYDYDTDYLYWTPLFQGNSGVESSLAIIDPETGLATSLGTVGNLGAQVSGLYIISDEFPEENPRLSNVVLNKTKTSVSVGSTTEISATILPMTLDAEVVWSSADESIATVENGVITGVSTGKTVITATVTYEGVTMTASCEVVVLPEGASFLAYNVTDGGWAHIDRADTTVVTNLTEGQDEAAVVAIASDGTDVYGYDVDNQLFKLDLVTFERTNIGDGLGLDVAYDDGFAFEVRDMAYDAANDRYLVLGATLLYEEWWEGYGEYSEIYGGCGIYELDLTTGALELLYTLEEHAYVMAIAVDGNGYVYFYSTFMDYFTKLDLTTGEWTDLITLQRQSVYGDSYCDYSMYYDDLTGLLYMLFTSNGNVQNMVTVDPSTGELVIGDYVGEVEVGTWYSIGDIFAGLIYIENMPEAPEEETVVDFVSANTNLDAGNINLNFYVLLSDNVVNNPTTEVHFTVNGETQVVPMSEAVVSVKDGVTRYRFTCELFAKQMADDVLAEVYVDGEPVGETVTYSIKKYCEVTLQNEADNAELIALVKAMLNYGAAAQVHFGYHTENLANASLAEEDKVLAAVDASAFAHAITGSEDGIAVTSANLVVEFETSIRVYFTLTGDKTIDEYVFTIDGAEAAPVATTVEGKYYIELDGIGARGLDEAHEFSVGGLTLTYSALSYVNQVLNNSSNTADLVDLAKALYFYNAAAEAYFG